MTRVNYCINFIIFLLPKLQILNKQALTMIKSIQHKKINYTVGLIFFLGTAYQNKANPSGFIFLACS